MLDKVLQLLGDERIVLALLWVFLCFFIFIVDVTTETIRTISQAKRIIKTRTPILLKLKKHYDTLSNQASCYANTLGGEGAKLLSEIREMIESNIRIIKILDSAISDIDIEEIKHTFKEEPYVNKDNFNMDMKKAEKIIAHLSEKILSASATATSLGLPKIRKRNLTADSLKSLHGDM